MLFLYIQLVHDLIILLLLWFLFSKSGRRQFHTPRKSVKRFWQRQKDRHARQWHPKTPHDCPHCCAGVKLQVARKGDLPHCLGGTEGGGGTLKKSNSSTDSVLRG